MSWQYSPLPSLPFTPGRLFVPEDNSLGSPGNIPHPTFNTDKLLLIPLWYFFMCRVSVPEQPQRIKWAAQRQPLPLFSPVIKAVRKSRAVNCQSGPIVSSIPAGNFFSSSSFQILFALFPCAAASETTMDMTNADSRACLLLLLFFLCGSRDTPPLSLVQIPLHCYIILKSVVSNDSQTNIICKYRCAEELPLSCQSSAGY